MKKDLRFIQSKAAIINAAIKTLIINPSAAMSEIAIAADVGRATLYRHYETKEVLVKALALECMKESEIALKPAQNLNGRPAIEAIFTLLMPLADRYQFLASIWNSIENDKDLTKIEARMKKDMNYLIDQAKKRNEINCNLPTEWIAAFFDSTFTAAWSQVSSNRLSQKQAVDFAIQSFFNGCGDNN